MRTYCRERQLNARNLFINFVSTRFLLIFYSILCSTSTISTSSEIIMEIKLYSKTLMQH